MPPLLSLGLVTGNVGATKREDGGSEVLSLQIGGLGRTSFSHAEGGTTSFEAGGGGGGCTKSFGPAIYPFCSPPPPPPRN